MSEQKLFAGIIGCVLIARGLLGFLIRASLPGTLSATLNHNLIHTLFGIAYVWVGVYAAHSAACKWNKFLGIVYALIAFFGVQNYLFLSSHLGANTLADNAFNFIIAAASLLVGFKGEQVSELLSRRHA
jgi:hypothetical protein